MKKNMNNAIRQLTVRLSAWMHCVIGKMGDHLEICAWYPGPCQTEHPF